MNTDGDSALGAANSSTPPAPPKRARRVSWRMALLGLLGLIVAAHAYCLYEPQYRSTAILRIGVKRPTITGAISEPLSPTEFDQFVRTQVSLLKSPIVLDRVLGDPTIARMPELRSQRSPIDWLAGQLSIESIENSELFRISFVGPDAKNAADLTNAVLDAYIKIESDLNMQELTQIIDLLDKELDRRAREVERMRQNVRALVKIMGESADAVVLALLPPSNDRRPTSLDRAKLALEECGRALERDKLRREALAAKLESLPADDPQRASLLPQLTALEIETTAAAEYRTRLKAEIADLETKDNQNGNHAADLVFMIQDLQRSEVIYKQIADRSEELKIELRSPDRVGEMRRASVPVLPEHPWWIRWSPLAWSW